MKLDGITLPLQRFNKVVEITYIPICQAGTQKNVV
jgi:hypothetical protein